MTIVAASEETWPTLPEAAEQLGIHQRTLRRYINEGRIAKTELAANVVRIRPEDIEAFLRDNVRISNGTGTCYVPRFEQPKPQPKRKPKRKPTPEGHPF